MAVYFDQRLETDYSTLKTDVQWHNTHGLLAVTSYTEDIGGAVNLYDEEGELLIKSCHQRSSQVQSLAWHPNKRIVVIGWENGEISVRNEQDGENHDAPQQHKAAITVLQWSSNGTRLVSADKAGVLIVWRCDAKGRLQQNTICQHTMNEPLTQIVFQPQPVQSDSAVDISQLARAAVSGDEAALDMFLWKKGNKSNIKFTTPFASNEAVCFFIGGENGGVFYVNETGKYRQSFTVEGSVKCLLFCGKKQVLITVTESLMLTQHNVLPEGDTKEIIKVKLSGKADESQIILAGSGLLATSTGESVVRLWDLETEENYVLSLDNHTSYNTSERIQCIAYCPQKDLLTGGTNMGNIMMWKYSSSHHSTPKKQSSENRWKLQTPCSVEGPIRQLMWGTSHSLLAVNTYNNVFILSEQIMNSSFSQQTAVVQVGPSQVAIDMFASDSHHELKTEIQIKGVYTTKDALVVWNGKKAMVYEYSSDKSIIRAAGAFATESSVIVMYEQNLYTIEPGKVQVRTFQGTVKQLLTFLEAEGEPICLSVNDSFLVIGTNLGGVRIYDLSRREAKLHSNPKMLPEVIPGFGSVLSARCNCAGSRVSILANKPDLSADSKLYVWDIDLDTVTFFNFASGRGEQDDYPPPQHEGSDAESQLNDEERGKNQAAKDVAGRHPISHIWDPGEPKLLLCEAKVTRSSEKSEAEDKRAKHSLTKVIEEGPAEVMIVSLFSTSENGVLIQDSYPMNTEFNKLLAVDVPQHYFLKKSELPMADEESPQPSSASPDAGASGIINPKMVARKTMRDFLGLENSDKGTRDAMMNFSFYLAIGNMDEAFKAIKLIKSESVWENMAKMCVKSRRLDVASVCLGNMGHARGAKALREAAKEPELDARVAVLAIQLGLYEDAERLIKNCQRYDLLNEFYQSRGDWGKAMETAEMYDRIHLRRTYYNYAKHLESKGDINGAIPNYEKSDTYRFEVPRMLFDDADALEAYIHKGRDVTMRKWWAQFLESTGDMDHAIQYYEAAQDYLSLVRVYCYCGDMAKAAQVCQDTGDKAACYHIARQYENQDMIRESIHFFSRAGAYGNAIRLCKENDLEDQIVNLALLGKPADQLEAARFLEQNPKMQDKAVMLYHKAGNFAKALDLAFKSKQFGALSLISGDLDERADPELIQRCATFFLENMQYDKAVELLSIGKKYWEALKISMDQHVIMTEELAEKLTPAKVADEDANAMMERNRILEGIGEVALHQGQHHIATKKFTQAGNKLKAMKSLLKSGDTEKIVFFAGVSRQKEIYVMAANYLQSLDWRKDPVIMKNIISFYTKGRALDSLAGFYDACAQVEIDEYQNYEKAMGALGEAYKCMAKAKLPNEALQEEKITYIKHKVSLIKKFVTAKRTYSEEPEEAMKQCQVLMEEPELDSAVRIGDLYGFMIEHYVKTQKWKAAYSCLDDMRSKVSPQMLAYYVNPKTVQTIYQALDMPMDHTAASLGMMNGFRGSGVGAEDDLNDEVEEDVISDLYGSEVTLSTTATLIADEQQTLLQKGPMWRHSL